MEQALLRHPPVAAEIPLHVLLRRVRPREDGSKTERFRENTEGNRLFVVRLIREYGVEPLYINLYAEHVLTDEDVRNATEVNPAKVSFVGGDAPKTLKFETDRFYRFTCRRASEIRTYCCPSSAPAHAMDY